MTTTEAIVTLALFVLIGWPFHCETQGNKR